MANRNNTGRTKKSYSYRPYDTSNSFVKRITAKVSEILPQPTSWVSRLFSSSSKLNVRDREELAEEEEDEEERQPPSKRICFSTTETDYSHQNNINRLSVLEADSGEISPIASSRVASSKNDDHAVPGPSGLHIRHFPISSTPALRPPPAISSAPIILSGESTSGQQEERRRQQGDDASDESESTSGCSSLVPGSRLRPEQPQTTNPTSGSLQRSSSSVQKNSQSLNRSNLNLSTSSQPAFDTYVFNNPLNRSGLGRRLLGDESCFYSGNTTFGGSSARTLNPAPAETPRVVTVRPSPSRHPHQDTIGSSALKILKALQQFSTPVMDAKRMPIRKSEVKKKPVQPYEELIFPSMPDLLRVKRRERELKAAEKSDQPDCPSFQQTTSLPSTSGLSQYTFREESQKDKHIGSIKGRGKEKDFELERVPAIILPNTVKLELNTLPKLDLTGSKKEAAPARKPSPIKSTQPYQFSNPQEPRLSPSKTGTLSLPSPLLFKFCEPLEPLKPKKKEESSDSAPSATEKSLPLSHQMKNPSPNFNLKRKNESNFNFISKSVEVGQSKEKPTESNVSTTNSVCTSCTITKKCTSCAPQGAKNENNSSSDSLWECLKCSQKYPSSEEKCKSCNLKKGEKPLNSNAIKHFQGFSKPKDTWECKECFVQNKNTIDTCVACSTPKAGKSEVNKNLFQFTSTMSTETKVNDSGFNSLISSVKTPEGSWECSTCLVRNKKDLLKCAACSSDKPGVSASISATKPSFSFGIPSNSSQLKTETSINLGSSSTTPQFTFGIPADSSNSKSSSTTSTNEKKVIESLTSTSTVTVTSTVTSSAPLINTIKKAEGSWECNTCLVQNKKESTSCVACNTPKPGCATTKLPDKPKETFTFGFPSANPLSSASGFAVSANSSLASSSSNAQPIFTFSSTTPVEKDTSKVTPPVFSFTASSNAANTNTNEVKPFSFINSDQKEEITKFTNSSNLFESKLKPSKTEEMNEDCDDKPAKKRVSFGNPLTTEKIVNNNGNTNFGVAVPNKPNEPVSSSNFTFTPFESSNKIPVPSSNSFFTFGSSNASETPKLNNLEQVKPITFGDSAQPALTANNTFGSSLGVFKLPEPENKPFTFMANSQTTTPSGGFSFNSTSQPPKFESQVNDSKPNTLFFGQQQPTPSAPAPPTLFGQLPQEQKPFVFNAPAQIPTQPVFSINSTPTQAPSGGNLGTSAPGGFTFSDPTLKPTFNFTGGATPAFSAAPSAVVSERKMKRGIRRVTANR